MRATLVGDLSSAVEYNPASPLLVAGAPLALAREAYGRFRGRWLNLRLVHRRTAVGLALVLLAALWMRQQAHADLLQQSADRGLPTGLWLYAVGLPSAVLIAAGVALWRRVRPPG